MIGKERKAVALYSMLRAWRSYGDRAFRVNRYGEHWGPLCDAERIGWVTWIGDRCRLTPAGIEQVIPYQGKVEAMLQEAAE